MVRRMSILHMGPIVDEARSFQREIVPTDMVIKLCKMQGQKQAIAKTEFISNNYARDSDWYEEKVQSVMMSMAEVRNCRIWKGQP